MKPLILTSVIALALFLSPIAPVLAQDAADTSAFDALPWYISAKAGVALPGTIRIDGSVGSAGFPAFTGEVGFDAGPSAAFAFGANLTDQMRAELELGFASNTARSYDLTFAGGNGTFVGAATGTVTTTWLMAVGYYDFTQLGDFVPYLSAGLGVANVSTNDLVVFNPTGTTTGSSVVPIARIGAGFSYALSDSLSIGADYFAAFGGRATLTYNDPANANTRTITSDVMGHGLSVGLKLRF